MTDTPTQDDAIDPADLPLDALKAKYPGRPTQAELDAIEQAMQIALDAAEASDTGARERVASALATLGAARDRILTAAVSEGILPFADAIEGAALEMRTTLRKLGRLVYMVPADQFDPSAAHPQPPEHER